jgi:hypothetical protein
MAKKGWAWTALVRAPRPQGKTIGKQEGTTPKKLRGKKKKMTNINDQMRAWKNTLDGGSIPEVRAAAVEILDQLRHTVENPAYVPEPTSGTSRQPNGGSADSPAEAPELDLTAKRYQELCATVDNLRDTLTEWEAGKKKTIPVNVVREIIGQP